MEGQTKRCTEGGGKKRDGRRMGEGGGEKGKEGGGNEARKEANKT
jgi:hypothetical protein